jgi:hypothetical protein
MGGGGGSDRISIQGPEGLVTGLGSELHIFMLTVLPVINKVIPPSKSIAYSF